MDGTPGEALLTAFGERIGLPEIGFTDGHAAIGFDDIEINIDYRAVGQTFLIYTEIMRVAGRIPEALLLQIAELNYGTVMLGAGALAMDTTAGSLLLVYHLPIEGLAVEKFEQHLKSVIEHLEVLREAFGQPRQTRDDKDLGLGDAFMIRA